MKKKSIKVEFRRVLYLTRRSAKFALTSTHTCKDSGIWEFKTKKINWSGYLYNSCEGGIDVDVIVLSLCFWTPNNTQKSNYTLKQLIFTLIFTKAMHEHILWNDFIKTDRYNIKDLYVNSYNSRKVENFLAWLTLQ